MSGVPFKVFLRSKNIKVGVVARSLEHLQSLIKEKFGLPDADIALEDGTLICNEEYFTLLEPQTNLVVQPAGGIGQKRSYHSSQGHSAKYHYIDANQIYGSSGMSQPISPQHVTPNLQIHSPGSPQHLSNPQYHVQPLSPQHVVAVPQFHDMLPSISPQQGIQDIRYYGIVPPPSQLASQSTQIVVPHQQYQLHPQQQIANQTLGKPFTPPPAVPLNPPPLYNIPTSPYMGAPAYRQQQMQPRAQQQAQLKQQQWQQFRQQQQQRRQLNQYPPLRRLSTGVRSPSSAVPQSTQVSIIEDCGNTSGVLPSRSNTPAPALENSATSVASSVPSCLINPAGENTVTSCSSPARCVQDSSAPSSSASTLENTATSEMPPSSTLAAAPTASCALKHSVPDVASSVPSHSSAPGCAPDNSTCVASGLATMLSVPPDSIKPDAPLASSNTSHVNRPSHLPLKPAASVSTTIAISSGPAPRQTEPPPALQRIESPAPRQIIPVESSSAPCQAILVESPLAPQQTMKSSAPQGVIPVENLLDLRQMLKSTSAPQEAIPVQTPPGPRQTVKSNLASQAVISLDTALGPRQTVKSNLASQAVISVDAPLGPQQTVKSTSTPRAVIPVETPLGPRQAVKSTPASRKAISMESTSGPQRTNSGESTLVPRQTIKSIHTSHQTIPVESTAMAVPTATRGPLFTCKPSSDSVRKNPTRLLRKPVHVHIMHPLAPGSTAQGTNAAASGVLVTKCSRTRCIPSFSDLSKVKSQAVTQGVSSSCGQSKKSKVGTQDTPCSSDQKSEAGKLEDRQSRLKSEAGKLADRQSRLKSEAGKLGDCQSRLKSEAGKLEDHQSRLKSDAGTKGMPFCSGCQSKLKSDAGTKGMPSCQSKLKSDARTQIAGNRVTPSCSSLSHLTSVANNQVSTSSTKSIPGHSSTYKVISCHSIYPGKQVKKMPALLPWPPNDAQSPSEVTRSSDVNMTRAEVASTAQLTSVIRSNIARLRAQLSSDVSEAATAQRYLAMVHAAGAQGPPGPRGGVTIEQTNQFVKRLADTLERVDSNKDPNDEGKRTPLDKKVPCVKRESHLEQEGCIVIVESSMEAAPGHDQTTDQPGAATELPGPEKTEGVTNVDSNPSAPTPSEGDSQSLPVKSDVPRSCNALQSLKTGSESLPKKPILLRCLPNSSIMSDSPIAHSDEGYISCTPSSDADIIKQLPFTNFLKSFSGREIKNEHKCTTPHSSSSAVPVTPNVKVETSSVVQEVLVQSKDFEGDSSGDVHVMIKNGKVLECSIAEPSSAKVCINHSRGVKNEIKKEPKFSHPKKQVPTPHASRSVKDEHKCLQQEHPSRVSAEVPPVPPNSPSPEPETDACEELVVSFRTMCWNGRILVVSNESNRIPPVIEDDNIPETSEPAPNKVESEHLELELDTDDEENCPLTIDLTENDTDSEYGYGVEEENSPQDDVIECEVVPMEMDVPIADYASEECVQTLPKSPVLCTNVDIDRCVGSLLAKEYSRQRRPSILDEDSILHLQAKSCALEEFSSISNEVVVGEITNSDADLIPLNKSSVEEIRSSGVPKVSKHMLSFQASTSISEFTESNTRITGDDVQKVWRRLSPCNNS